MNAYHTTAAISQDGTLELKALPFPKGEVVEVIVLPKQITAESKSKYPLQGTPYEYNDPFEPVAAEDWEALQ
ncbi:MAG: hypothetical protein HY960_15995 [Ignavibacteriae bacterium]|nr:hypothetical protein [Ignavibacteriota bacterium]